MVYHLENDKSISKCPICGNTVSTNDKEIKEIEARKNAQKEFGKYIVVHRSHAPNNMQEINFLSSKKCTIS